MLTWDEFSVKKMSPKKAQKRGKIKCFLLKFLLGQYIHLE